MSNFLLSILFYFILTISYSQGIQNINIPSLNLTAEGFSPTCKNKLCDMFFYGMVNSNLYFNIHSYLLTFY